jgi:hypothetical protein
MGLRLNRLFRWLKPPLQIVCLTERVELDSYLSGYGGENNRSSVESFRNKVDREILVGDQLWNYHTRGYHQRCGMGGLALVRGGRVVKLWCLWIA